MAARLTELSVARAAAKPGERIELPDGLVPGLQLRVGERGKTWTLLYRARGKQRRLKLGAWPTVGAPMPASSPRPRCSNSRPAKTRPPTAKTATFEAVAAELIERHIRRRHKRPAETEAILRKLSAWPGRPGQPIRRLDVLRLLDLETDAGRQRAANKLLRLTRQLFGWAIERGLAENNPALGIRRPGRERSRDRVLSDAELAAIWHAAGKLGWPWSPWSGCSPARAPLREVAELRWAEVDVDGRRLVLDGSRTKSGRPQTTALNALALEVSPSAAHRQPATSCSRPRWHTNAVSGFAK